MKHYKKLRLSTLVLLGLLTFSCQNEDLTSEKLIEEITVVENSNLIDFKGLPVNHRFSTPIEELEIIHTESNLKTIYNTARTSRANQKGIVLKTVEAELPDPEIIVEASSNVIELFPYETSDEETSESANMDMIESDFPTLSKEEIVNNIEIIDEYYSQNLDYVVLNEVAQNETTYQNIALKTSNTQKTEAEPSKWELFWCTMWKFQEPWKILVPVSSNFIYNTREFSYTRSVIAFYYSQLYAKKYSEEEYGVTSDNKGDAYKHILWNSFLAHYYYTVTSKSKRLRFAEAITYAYEDCSINDDDAREMDYHNNYIGRKLWDDNCSYRKWWRWTVGLRKPNISTLKTKAKQLVEAGKFIDDEIHTSIPARAFEITNKTSKYQAVYLIK